MLRRDISGLGAEAFVEHVGDNVDESGIVGMVVRAARVSFANDSKSYSDERDANLFKYLVENRHLSPLEHVVVSFHISAPLFVAVHFWRHRTASVNAVSARYVKISDSFYVPEKLRAQAGDNKQASVEASFPDEPAILARWRQAVEEQYSVYEWMLSKGVSREQARALLPEGRFTRWYWTMDLRNLLHFLSLRLDAGAQYETRQYALAIAEIMKELDPSSWNLIEAIGFDGL